MDEVPPPTDQTKGSGPGRRPSFSAFWKHTNEASASAARQVTFMPIEIPRIAKNRANKKHKEDVSRSSTRSHMGGRGDDQGEEGDMKVEGEEGAAGPDAGGVDGNSAQRSANEKARLRRAQVRRAQITHRKRKADYMQQLELDINILRDMITTTEQDMRDIQKENDEFRMQLGVVTMMRNARSNVDVGAGVVAFGGESSKSTAAASIDAAMADVPACTTHSSHGGGPVVLASSPSDTASSSETGATSVDSPMSSETGTGTTDLDEIHVSVVMDKVIGNPVYKISSMAADATLTFSSEFNDTIPRDPRDMPVSPYEAGFVPTFETELAGSTAAVQHTATALFLPDLTVAETHAIVNFILALEHVCWGHAGHQFHDPALPDLAADHGHVMMATSLFLRDAPEAVLSTIEGSNRGMAAFVTNQAPADAAATGAYLDAHGASKGLSWQAPDVSLKSLYGLAVSLNPLSEKELAPVQAWFELAARFPLSVLLRADVVDGLKRELVGVVRCLYFGAVMEREAFESVVQRVIEPVAQAEAERLAMV